MSVDAVVEIESLGIRERAPEAMDPRGELTYGARIGYVLGWIDRECATLGCARLGSFVVSDDSETPAGPWFSARDALVVVRRVEAHLDELDPDERIRNYDHSTEVDRESLAWDLKAIRLILEDAERANRRVRILSG